MMETQFKAMNCKVRLTGMEPELQIMIVNLFLKFEQKISRFIPDNSLAHINNSPLHTPVFLDETLADLLEKSLHLSRKANYYVHPFLGDVMKEIGYTHSFNPDYNPVFEEKESFVSKHFEEPIEMIAKQWIIKKQSFSFDFGGFGKGYVVESRG